MIQSFRYSALPGEVVYGAGVLDRISEEISRCGFKRALILCTPEQRSQAERVAALLGERSVGNPRQGGYARAGGNGKGSNRPRRKSLGRLRRGDWRRIDHRFGQGDCSGVRHSSDRHSDHLCGSEMTPIFGLTEAGVKRTGRDLRVLPRLVLYDPLLTLTLPVGLSVTSGINAIAHAVEALYATDGNPIFSMMAEEGIRALATGLPKLVNNSQNLEARTECLYGAWLCGTVLGSTNMALHHKLCHTLGGTFNLPHAETHTIVLPHSVAYNQVAAPEAMARVARALGCTDAAVGLWDLAKACGAPLALRDIGLPKDGIDRAVELSLANPYAKPAGDHRSGPD